MPEASVKTSKMSNEMQEFALSTANDAIKNQWNEQVLLVISMREKKKKFPSDPYLSRMYAYMHTHKYITGSSIDY